MSAFALFGKGIVNEKEKQSEAGRHLEECCLRTLKDRAVPVRDE